MSVDPDLPTDWERYTVADLAEPKGIAYGVLKPGPRSLAGVPMLRVSDVRDGRVDATNIYMISPELDAEYRRTKLRGGEVVLSIQGSVGRVAVVPPELAGANVSRTLAMIRPKDPKLASWIHRALESPSAQAAMRQVIGGTTRDSLNLRDLRQIEVPIPPESVRSQILTLVDRASSMVDSSSAHLAAARGSLARFHQSVLASACSGRLTADWRAQQVGSDAATLVERSVQLRTAAVKREPLTPASWVGADERPESWAYVSLDSVTTRITSGSRDWSRFYGRGSGTFVMAQNVRPGAMDWSFRQAVDPPMLDASRERSQIRKGDLLVTIVGANTGDVAPIVEDRPETFVCQSVALIRPADPEWSTYLNLWFNSSAHGQRYFAECMYGEGRPHLSFDQLRAAPVAIPPLDEQHEIVRRADELLRVGAQLGERINAAAGRVERSGQAILAKAFRGELGL